MPNPYIAQIKLGTGPNDPVYDIKAAKMASGPVGTTLKPIYINNDGDPTATEVSESGNRWGVIPLVGATGILEAGKYIDFHNSDEHTGEYDYRITTDASSLTLTPTTAVDSTSTSTGSLIVTGGMGVSQTITADKLKITGSQDINSSFSVQGALQIGELDGYNLAFNRGNIMARNNGAATTLFLNGKGGQVVVGDGGLKVGQGAIAIDCTEMETALTAGAWKSLINAKWKTSDKSATIEASPIRIVGNDANANPCFVFGHGGNTVISAGENATGFLTAAAANNDGENIYAIADSEIYLITHANTVADRLTALHCYSGGGVQVYAHGTATATVRNISFGTTAPSGGSNGDIYLWYA